jgi:hypothetical protein
MPHRVFRFVLLLLCALAALAVRPAHAGIFGKDTRDVCMEKYSSFAPTIFLAGFYYQICETLTEPEPKIENKMFFAPVPKPRECVDYAPAGKYITPHQLGICRIDRWKMRQKWAKCRIAEKESPDVQTDRAIELVLSGQDSSECGPWAPVIDPNAASDSCVWPVCPFWSLSPAVPSAIDKFAMRTISNATSESNHVQCADVKSTVAAMLALYDADKAGYKNSADYATLKKKLDNLPYPELPCPHDVAPEEAPAAAPPVEALPAEISPAQPETPVLNAPSSALPPDAPVEVPADAQPSALPVVPPAAP